MWVVVRIEWGRARKRSMGEGNDEDEGDDDEDDDEEGEEEPQRLSPPLLRNAAAVADDGLPWLCSAIYAADSLPTAGVSFRICRSACGFLRTAERRRWKGRGRRVEGRCERRNRAGVWR